MDAAGVVLDAGEGRRRIAGGADGGDFRDEVAPYHEHAEVDCSAGEFTVRDSRRFERPCWLEVRSGASKKATAGPSLRLPRIRAANSGP